MVGKAGFEPAVFRL